MIRSKSWAALNVEQLIVCYRAGLNAWAAKFLVSLCIWNPVIFIVFMERQFWNLPVTMRMGFVTCWRLFLSCCVLSAFPSFSHQDCVPLVDQQLLYTCCPYLGEYFIYICYINKMLVYLFIYYLYLSFGTVIPWIFLTPPCNFRSQLCMSQLW